MTPKPLHPRRQTMSWRFRYGEAMTWMWTWWQSVTYDWPDWTRPWLAPRRWQNPTCDVPPGTRRLDRRRVEVEGQPVNWPAELADLNLNVRPPGQTPWQGSVGGAVLQMVDPARTKRFTVDNRWGGTLHRDGAIYAQLKAGDRWPADIPVPINNGWGVEGYPNGANLGDRHWFGIEPDGSAHEVIWLGIGTPTVLNYVHWGPNGELLDGMPGGVVKGGQQFTSIVWNRGDQPHRLGLVFHNLAASPVLGESDGDAVGWEAPAYGQLFRLSREEFDRQLELGPNGEQRIFLESLRFYGAEPYDRGGSSGPHASIGQVGGAQQAGSTIGELNIPLAAMELVSA